jgi:hypothetical protein
MDEAQKRGGEVQISRGEAQLHAVSMDKAKVRMGEA